MSAPNFPWAALSDAETAAGAPLSGNFAMAIRNDLEHLREVVYDPEIHTAAQAHSHNGLDSGHVGWASSNVCVASVLSKESVENSLDWYYGGGARFVSHTETPAGACFRNRGEYIYNFLAAGDGKDEQDIGSHIVFGRGATLAVSIWATAQTATPAEGRLLFGLSRNEAQEFAPGCMAAIDACEINAGAGTWQRYWFRCKLEPGGEDFGARVCLLIGVDETFDTSIVVNAVQVTVGPQLCYWASGNNEPYLRGTRYLSRGIPVWSKSKSITSAVRLVPR